MGRWTRHRWVIVAAALTLVLTVGAVSWAATGSTTPTTPGNPSQQGPAYGHGFGMMGREVGPRGGGMGPGMRGFDGANGALQGRQARSDAILKLVRDKMSATDKATFDKLQQQQTTQREAVQKAADALRQTNEQLRSLVDKYLGVQLSPAPRPRPRRRAAARRAS